MSFPVPQYSYNEPLKSARIMRCITHPVKPTGPKQGDWDGGCTVTMYHYDQSTGKFQPGCRWMVCHEDQFRTDGALDVEKLKKVAKTVEGVRESWNWHGQYKE